MYVLKKMSIVLLGLTLLSVAYADVNGVPNASKLPNAYAKISHACPTSAAKCVVSYFKKISHGLCYLSIKAVNPKYWKESRKQQTLPNYKLIQNKPTTLPTTKILFMQDTASGLFSDNKQDVIDVANQLKNGIIKTFNLPTIQVWQDEQGRIWTINHRRLIAMILAGVDQVPVAWATQSTVLQNKKEFTTTSGGKKMSVWLTNQVEMVISNDGRCVVSSIKTTPTRGSV